MRLCSILSFFFFSFNDHFSLSLIQISLVNCIICSMLVFIWKKSRADKLREHANLAVFSNSVWKIGTSEYKKIGVGMVVTVIITCEYYIMVIFCLLD